MNKKAWAHAMRFERHGGIYRSDVCHVIATGYGAASRWSAPVPSERRDGRFAPCPSFTMSSGRLFLDGMVATRARLRFTGKPSIKCLPSEEEPFTIER